MTKSVTKIQDKDTRKRLSVVRSKEDPTKYGVVILNPDGSRIRGPKGETGEAATVEVGYTCTGEPGTSACVTNSGDCHHATLNFTIPEGQQGEIGPTGNGICCTTCSKVGKTTTVQFDYTNGTDFCFSVQDGQDGQGSGDMLKCVYDPNGCERNVFDYDNLDNKPDLSCYQEKLTAGNGIDITSNKISTTFIYGESSTAAATVQKVVNIPSITELNVGQVIIVKPTVTSTVAASTLKLNSFPAYKMLYNGSEISTSTDSIVWGANVPSMFYLDEVSGTKYWRFLGHGLDSNSTYTLNRLIDPSRYKVGTGTYAFSRYSLVMEKADGTWEKITNTAAAYSTGTSKTVNTNGFRLGHIRYYNTTSNLANGALVGSNAIDIQAPSVTAAYSFNCGTAPGWAVGTPIYLVGSMGADGLFYLDTTQRWSTTLPGANDGKLYIRLGTSLSADNSTFSLITEKPIFYYDNGIKVYGQADNKQDVISDLNDIRNCACCALPNTTKYGASLDMTMDPSTFVLQTQLKDQDGCNLGSACCIDLPIESVVVCGCYDCVCKEVELDLQGGSCIRFGIGDLVCGLQTEIDSCHKICSDYVDDTGQCNLFVSCTEKNCWNGKAEVCDIPTDNCQLCNGCGYTKECNIATINGCCITEGGDVCIQSGADYSRQTPTPTNISDNVAMRGPADEGYHIPMKDERVNLTGILTTTFGLAVSGTTLKTYLKMPLSGNRDKGTSNAAHQGASAGYWSATASTANYAYRLYVNSSTFTPDNTNYRAYGFSIRTFKNVPVIPDSNWTTLYDGSLVASNAGIFHNATEGLISISGDGINWITIADKNLGATAVYNDGDTLAESNCGKYYQWGNNNGFDWTGSVTTSSTQVDATDYGPGNYYSSSTFIIGSNDRSSVQNDNLWGGTSTAGQFEISLRTLYTPTKNFEVVLPNDLKDGEEYVLRLVNTADEDYVMTLGLGFTNPWEVDLSLSFKASDQFVFLSIGGELELQPLVACGN